MSTEITQVATGSTQEFTKEVVNKLDSIAIFSDLMVASTTKDSIFIKAKETLQALFDAGSYTEREKSEIIAQTLSQMASSITNSAMQTAFQMSKENRDAPYALAKIVADTKLAQEQADKISEENLLLEEERALLKAKTSLTDEQVLASTADRAKTVFEGWRIQGEMFAKNGISVIGQNITVPILTSVAQTNPLASDVVSSETGKANKLSILAGTFRKDGFYTWTTDANKDIAGGTDATPAGWKPLTPAQTAVAIRQEKAFDDNMKQHAANSSANMIGLLLSSENYAVLTEADVERWRVAVNYLNAV